MLVNQTNGYAEMGIFNAANQWRTAILFLPHLIGGIVLPILSSLTAIDQRHDYNKILFANILINGIVAFGAAIFISLLAPVILGIYGRDFIGGKYVLIFLSFSTVFMAMNDVIGLAIASMGKMWYGLLFNSLWAVLLIACTYILLGYHYGATGLSIAIFVSYIMHSLWQGIFFYRFLKARR
jgi:O-antigen/teichoic acid export membrane protein